MGINAVIQRRGPLAAAQLSYRNRQIEATVKAIIDEVAPELITSCSADIWPIICEYERTINAYVQLMVINYLESFEQALQRLGVKPPPRITKSNGGVMGLSRQNVNVCRWCSPAPRQE